MKIKLMADYHCWPLWHADAGKVGNIDPSTLPLSAVMRQRLQAWATCYDHQLNQENPMASVMLPEEATWFQKEGQALWKDLQKELGSAYEVIYTEAKS